jgi:hypothetical protein
VKLLQRRKGNWDNEYCIELPYEIDTGTLWPIASKIFPFSTVVGIIVGATM